MHLRFNFDACPMHSPFGFVHLMHQNLSARAWFCLNSLAKVNMQLLIYNYFHVQTDQINTEFKVRARSLHPDKNPDDPATASDEFAKLQRARDVLTDDKKRQEYDFWRRSGVAVPYDTWMSMKDSMHTVSKYWAPRIVQRVDYPSLGQNWEVEQKPRGRGYDNYPLKIRCDNIIMHSCWKVRIQL